MTNEDSIFKSRDITLPTKVRLVKAMVFPRSALRFWLLGLESHIEISGVESLMCGFCSAETTSTQLSCPSPTVMS